MNEEARLPEAILRNVQKIAPVLEAYFPRGSLKMGGGTVLQARWRHSVSTDADLFAFPQAFNKVVAERGEILETETSATILSKKIVHRMIQTSGFEVRDLFDVYTAMSQDPDALDRALAPIRAQQLIETIALL